ncbi:MAG: transporter, partial [Frankiales bacterium]|nr:transporter [Frankiales bacterium]
LTTAARADRILVMSSGRVVEDGTHDGLLAADSLYAALWRSYLHGSPDQIDPGAVGLGPVSPAEPVSSRT